MANKELSFGKAKLVVRHVPEPDETYDPAAHDKPDHITGFIDVGAEIDGVVVPLVRRKASGLAADIERAKANAPESETPDE